MRELHAAAASKFLSPRGLESNTGTGAGAVASPTVVAGQVQGEGDGGDGGQKSPGLWGGILDAVCCRRRGGAS